MLRFRPDHHKTKKMCKNAVKKLLFIIMCVPAQYQTQEISDKVILENGGLLRLIARIKKCVIKLLIIMLMH